MLSSHGVAIRVIRREFIQIGFRSVELIEAQDCERKKRCSDSLLRQKGIVILFFLETVSPKSVSFCRCVRDHLIGKSVIILAPN